VEEILELRGDDGRLSAFVRSITHPGPLPIRPAPPDLNVARKSNYWKRSTSSTFELALRLQQERLTELTCRSAFERGGVRARRSSNGTIFCAAAMELSARSLARPNGSVSTSIRKKMAAAQMPEQVQRQAERELGRLERMGDSNAEASMIRTYLDWLLACPGPSVPKSGLIRSTRKKYWIPIMPGLDDVKRRITEYLAVRKLALSVVSTDIDIRHGPGAF